MGKKLYMDCRNAMEDEGAEVVGGSKVIRVVASECPETA
jgi:hypothetical protein